MPEDGEAPPPPAAVPRHTLCMARAGADAEPVRALSFIAGQPLPSGEALLAFGGQPADKPDALTLLPVTPSTVRSTEYKLHAARWACVYRILTLHSAPRG